MMLCVFLALLEGRGWASLLSTWLIQMLYALIFFDLAFTYIKFKLLGFYLEKRRAAMSSCALGVDATTMSIFWRECREIS